MGSRVLGLVMHRRFGPLLCAKGGAKGGEKRETKASWATAAIHSASILGMIRKLKSGQFRLYSRKKSEQTGKRRNLGTFTTLEAAKQHERAVQYFKRH
jgi:hypothetical protein